jgi:serine/threonine protein kinase
MSIPAISAQAQATASQVLPYQNTQDNKLSEDIEILTVIRKTSDASQENNPCSLFFNNSITDKKISIVGTEATTVDLKKTSQLDTPPPKQLLGEGFYGEVFKGLLQYKNGLQRKAAIKTVYLNSFYDEKKFYNEVKALKDLGGQDHIIQIYFALQSKSDCICHIIMEYGDIDLKEYIRFIKKHPEININNKQLAKIGHDIFSGMLACLEFNIFNLDIKPKNYVIIFSKNMIEMIDFGVLSDKKYLDDDILNKMIMQTANSFTQCAFNKVNSEDQETQNILQTIALNSANNLLVSDEDKVYFKQHIPTYVNDNPLLLKLTQEIFSGDGNISDITKTITDIKNKIGLQALTDIRPML